MLQKKWNIILWCIKIKIFFCSMQDCYVAVSIPHSVMRTLVKELWTIWQEWRGGCQTVSRCLDHRPRKNLNQYGKNWRESEWMRELLGGCGNSLQACTSAKWKERNCFHSEKTKEQLCLIWRRKNPDKLLRKQ